MINWDMAQFFITCPGMSDASMWSFEADDGDWFIYHGNPGHSMLVPFRRDGDAPTSVEDALFIADCIAFDHDTPTVLRPSATTPAAALPPVPPITPPVLEDAGIWYFEALAQAAGMATEIRVGEAVTLRYDGDNSELTRFTRRFAQGREPLALYAMATRQVDWMTEYLCLYRLLERADGANGMKFSQSHISDVESHPFGTLLTMPFPGTPIDVFEEYRSRAVRRIEDLRLKGADDKGIAQRLYGTRNGIAHGKVNVLISDFGDDIDHVAADLPLVKLLARMAVESLASMR